MAQVKLKQLEFTQWHIPPLESIMHPAYVKVVQSPIVWQPPPVLAVQVLIDDLHYATVVKVIGKFEQSLVVVQILLVVSQLQ